MCSINKVYLTIKYKDKQNNYVNNNNNSDNESVFDFKVLDANSCFEKQPPSALSLQLAAYYYSLQIYSRLVPCFKDQCSPLYRVSTHTHHTVSEIQVKLSHSVFMLSRGVKSLDRLRNGTVQVYN